MTEQRRRNNGNRGARRHQERKTERKPQHDYELAYDMSIGDLTRYLKKEYDIDFYNIEAKALKNKAVNMDSYMLDIVHDIKELFTDEGTDKYFYMDVLLTEFKKARELQT